MSDQPISQCEANKKLIASFMESFSRADMEGAFAMLSDDATWWIAGDFELSGSHSKQQFIELLGSIGEKAAGPISLKPVNMIAEGGSVAVEAESLGPMQDGRTYNNKYHFVFEVRDGQILAIREYMDTRHAEDILCR